LPEYRFANGKARSAGLLQTSVRRWMPQGVCVVSTSPGSIRAGFRLLAWLFPAPRLDKLTELSAEELHDQYKSRDRRVNLAVCLAYLGLAVGLFFLLDLAAAWRYRDLAEAEFLVRPVRVEFGVYAAFLSLTSSTFLLLGLLRWLLGRQEYTVYAAYLSQRAYPSAPWDVTQAFRWMFWLGFPPLVMVTLLRIDNYTAVTDKGVIDNPFWSVGTQVERPYTEVRGVYEIRGYHARFEDVVAPYHLIVFADGTRWQSPHGSGGPKMDHQRRLMILVAARSGREMRTVSFIEDVPP
jgi:hypothetical protein